jgi:hypothetical protein
MPPISARVSRAMGILSNRSLIFLAEKVSIHKDMPFQPKEQKKRLVNFTSRMKILKNLN